MAEKKQFDAFLGGSHSLPREVSFMKVISARASEISAMTYSIENPEQTKLMFQKLPVYMRRRVMSHNVKRLPRRLREIHMNQMAKSGLPPKSKRPSRKYRRRPSNLLLEYHRRQRNKIWLETHIWHAKRFHMIDKWGYRIANYPNDKCFKANYRAATEHCLLQDISYYTCIEISGKEDLLRTTLKTHCNPSALSFTAKKYIDGHNEGTVMFFKKNGYPQFPIGNVHFLWRPNKSDIKTIWIWVHPAFYTDFLNEIISSFEFKKNNVEEKAADSKNDSNSLYTNDKGCKMIILRYALNRFRLHGPLSLNILTKALKSPSLFESDLCFEVDSKEEQNNSLNNKIPDAKTISMDNDVSQPIERMKIDEANEDIPTKNLTIEELCNKKWYIEYYKDQENMNIFKIQKQLWEELQTSDLSHRLPQYIFGLTVLDPRFYLQEKRTKLKTKINSSQIINTPITSNYTPIWDTEIRNTVKNSCVSTNTINELRSRSLISGISNDRYYNRSIMAKIPILLIPRISYDTVIGSTIDIIIPAGWAMPFWLSFVQRCARVGALRESTSIAFESLNPNAPDVNDPDSPAYATEALSTKEELINKYFRYPPNRRVNFTKFGIHSPFFCDWKNLIKDWSDVEDFYVLRDRNILLSLQTNIRSQSFGKNKNTKHSSVQNARVDFQNLNEYKNCLVHVKISMLGKGTPKRFAIICAPTFEDLEKLEGNKKWTGPVEKRHADPHKASRKILRRNHLKLLKRLRRQRIRQKKMFESGTSSLLKKSIGKLNESSRHKIISEQSKKMLELYLPEYTEVRHSCDREVMGYLTIGQYSFCHAKGIGIGYVTLPSLIEMINKKSNIVLVRNTQTRQYRLAILDILNT